jgi:hypothetical protein
VNPAPQVLSVEKLTPAAVIAEGPPQFPPDGLLAMMLFLNVAVPRLKMPPPEPETAVELPEKVLLVTVSFARLAFSMPPPWAVAELPEKVQLVTAIVPPLAMPAANILEELPEKVLLVTVIVAPKLLEMPPPTEAVLPEKLLLVIVSVPPLMTPPKKAFEIVRPLIEAVTPPAMSKTLKAEAPLTANTSGPGPVIVRSCVIWGSALPSVIVPVTPA